MKLIEQYVHSGAGYNPYLIREGWQVAKLNYQSANGVDDITGLEVHRRTDEVFVLLSGNAALIAGAIVGDVVEFETVRMQTGIAYNIPAGCWHNIAMCPDAEMIIVERDGTHTGDVAFHDLAPEQCSELHARIARSLEMIDN